MSFSIGLGTVTADRHHLHKAIQNVANVTGELRDESSIIHPEIMIEIGEASITDCNYLSFTLGSRNRYYYIDDIIMYRTGIIICKCTLDPLMTYEAEILQVGATIERNEYEADSYLVDENYVIDAYSNYVTIDFPNGFDTANDTYVLMTVGGGEPI